MLALIARVQVKASMRRIGVLNAKEAKLSRTRKFLKSMWRKGCSMARRGEADEAPDTETGDIVFVLQLKDHSKFKKRGMTCL